MRSRFDQWIRRRTRGALPTRFDRTRIYVLPTRFGLFLAVSLATMGIGALNYNNNPALLLALLLAGAAMASLLATHLQLSGLVVDSIEAEPVAAGRPLHVRVHATDARERERRGLQVQIDDASAAMSLVEGRGEATLVLPTHVRGWQRPGRMRVWSVRPLGLARAWAYAWPDQALLVHPAPEPQGPPLPTGSGDGRRAYVNPAGDELHHLRNYRAGDARRSIAWKPSARRDALQVREYEQPVNAEIVLDWATLPAIPYEQRISRLAHWVEQAEREQLRYQLRLPQREPIGPDIGRHHLQACLRALALMPHAAA